MIRVTYPLSLALGALGMLGSVVAAIGIGGRLEHPISAGQLVGFLIPGGMGVSGLMFALRSRALIAVDQDGLRRLGTWGWRLAWAEVQGAHSDATRLALRPGEDALRRQSIRGAVQWSRWFAPRSPSGWIVLPRPVADEAARTVLNRHGIRVVTAA